MTDTILKTTLSRHLAHALVLGARCMVGVRGSGGSGMTDVELLSDQHRAAVAELDSLKERGRVKREHRSWYQIP